MRGCGSELRRAGRREVKATSLVLVFLLVVMIPVTTAPAQAARSVPRQNSDHGAARECSPPVGTYWAKTYEGIYADSANSVQETSDGGYVVAGYTISFGAGSVDFWVVKLGAGGDIVWDAGSNASTQTTSATPSDSSATVSTTSVTPADSAATVQNTQVTALDSNATVTVQSSGGGETGQEILLIIIVGLAAAVAVVVVVLAALVLMNRKKKSPTKIM